MKLQHRISKGFSQETDELKQDILGGIIFYAQQKFCFPDITRVVPKKF
jgi:hypothetical protein